MTDQGCKLPPRTKVFFRCESTDASETEEVRVVGGCEELGNWQPQHGVPLNSHPSGNGCWTSPSVSLPMGVPVHYKYVICKKGSLVTDGTERWEGREDNRFVVPTGRHHVLEDDGGKFRDVEVHTWARHSRVPAALGEDDNMSVALGDCASRSGSISILPERIPALGASAGASSSAPMSHTQSLSALPHEKAGAAAEADKPTNVSALLDRRASQPISQQAEVLPKLQSFENRRRKEEELEMLTVDDHIICTFRSLPFRVSKDKASGKWRVDGDSSFTFKVVSMIRKALLDGVPETDRTFNIKFVGDPGVQPTDPEDRKQITEALAAYSCVPVFMDSQVGEQALEFCHSFLWPVMHNMKVFDDETLLVEEGTEARAKFDEASWRNYQQFNRAYADAMVPLMKKQSLVWIHDFYLLLVPRFISLKCTTAAPTVGFMLHAAFPSSEVLMCMPCREEILQSMLSCKVLTFQVFEYARHFLSCCQYLLNTTHSFQGTGVLHIEHEENTTVIRSDHFVLPYKMMQHLCTKDNVKALAEEIRKPFGDKIVFGAIDGDEPFSGMILKLRAFHKFLSWCPQHQNSVGLLQHVLRRKTEGGDSDLLRDMKKLAEEINREFSREGRPAVMIKVGDLDADGRLSTMMAVDILLDTSINDGLNLHPFLFCAAHEQEKLSGEGTEGKACRGTMIVSEFSGCSSVLTGSVKVNPWHTQAVMDEMHKVITMDERELDRRFKQDHSYISTQSLKKWVTQNLAEIKKAAGSQSSGPVRGLGAGAQLFTLVRGFRHLDDDAVLAEYKKAKTRCIFLDNEGTLAHDERNMLRPYSVQEQLAREGRAPDPQVLECLKVLAADRANTVVVISGRNREVLDRWFGSVDGLGLCAEHGFETLLPSKLSGGKAMGWKCLEGSGVKDDDWKTIVFQLMKQYVKRVQGSIVEYKGSAITWNYRKVGAQQLAKEIALELARFLDPREGLMHGYPVRVVSGKGYVEVKRNDVDKGLTVSRLLREMGTRPDFILCIGDDRSDEDMFEVVNAIAEGAALDMEANPPGAAMDEPTSMSMVAASSPREVPSPKSRKDSEGFASGTWRLNKKASCTLEEYTVDSTDRGPKYYTVTVGRKPSKAGWFVKDVSEVTELLERLAKQTRAANLSRYQSMPTLCHKEDAFSSDEDD